MTPSPIQERTDHPFRRSRGTADNSLPPHGKGQTTPSPACGGGLGWGQSGRGSGCPPPSVPAPIPTFPRKRGKEQAGISACVQRQVHTQDSPMFLASAGQCLLNTRLGARGGRRVSLVGVTSTDRWKVRSSPACIAPTPTTCRASSLPSSSRTVSSTEYSQ